MAKILSFKNAMFRRQLQNAQYNRELREWAKEKIAERQKTKEETGNDATAQKG